ncbi:PAXX protein, partial [Nothocercus nigrocapillus]|nr:PAXX protein [Nothocercus nigrocapillus]
RKALARGEASLSVREDEGKATLQLREDAWRSALELGKLPVTEARTQLQALLFSLVGCVRSLEKRLEGLSLLKQPAQQYILPSSFSIPLTEADPRSMKNRGACSTLPAKRRVPGESLINPGFKSKKTPRGVDFEDS